MLIWLDAAGEHGEAAAPGVGLPIWQEAGERVAVRWAAAHHWTGPIACLLPVLNVKLDIACYCYTCICIIPILGVRLTVNVNKHRIFLPPAL